MTPDEQMRTRRQLATGRGVAVLRVLLVAAASAGVAVGLWQHEILFHLAAAFALALAYCAGETEPHVRRAARRGGGAPLSPGFVSTKPSGTVQNA